MSKEELLRRCLERVDQLTVSDGAMTFLDLVLGDMLYVLGAQPPFTPKQARILRAVSEWPTTNGGVAD